MMFGGSFLGLGATAGGLLGSVAAERAGGGRVSGGSATGAGFSGRAGLTVVGSLGVGLVGAGLTVAVSMGVGLVGAGLTEAGSMGVGLEGAGLTEVTTRGVGLTEALMALPGIFFSETLRLSTSRLMVGFAGDIGEEFPVSL